MASSVVTFRSTPTSTIRSSKCSSIDNIKWFALSTRIAIIFGQFISNLLCPDHVATDVFVSPNPPNVSISEFDRSVSLGLSGFLHWDAEYFYHIFRYGYIYENTIAFFPLFPLTIKLITWPFQYYFDYVDSKSLFLLAAVGANVFFFVRASVALYALTFAVTKSEKFAYKTAVLFCVNPASIFFTAPYSEALFAWITFEYMLRCVQYSFTFKATKHYIKFPSITSAFHIGILGGLSAITRSNGLTNYVIFLYAWTHILVNFVRSIRERIQSYHGTLKVEDCIDYIIFAKFIIQFFVVLVTLMFPFIVLQIYNYFTFCQDFSNDLPPFLFEYGVTKHFVFPGNFYLHQQSWCKSFLPLGYTYVQKTYWNVGFMNYYQLKQIPNFLLASPILVIMIFQSAKFIKRNHEFAMYLGLFPIKNSIMCDGFDSRIIFAFVLHGLFLTYVCICYVHIQVSTRFLSSATPIFYWYCAQFWYSHNVKKKSDSHAKNEASQSKAVSHQNKKLKTHGKSQTQILIYVYFCSYFVLGTILFSNNFPWT